MAAKDITIRIQAAGGDQAAAEVRKVENASAGLGKTLPGLSDAHQRAADAAIVQGQHMQTLASSQARVSASTVSMRTGLQNVGYQIQDFAVQTQSGTSAVRAFSQQAPQLLSALGPWGVGLGTIVALGAPLIGQLLGQADAAEDLGKAYESATEKTIELARAQRIERETSEQSAQAQAIMEESLREIVSARFAYNESIRESIDLLSQSQGAEAEIAAAKAETEIAAAEGNPVRQEEIRNIARKEAQERELRQIEERRKALSDLMDRRYQQQDSVRIQGGAEAERLRQQARNTGDAALTQEQTSETLSAQAIDLQERGQRTRGPAGAAMRREALDFKRRADAAKEAAEKLRAQERDLNQGATAAETTTEKEVKRLDDEMSRLFDEIRRLESESTTKTAVFSERDKQGEIRLDRVRMREDQQRKQQRERAGRERTQAESTAGRDAERLIPREASDQLREAIQRVSRGLQDGDQGGELAQLIALLQQLANVVDKKDQGKQKEIDALKQRIANMEQQTKNNRK